MIHFVVPGRNEFTVHQYLEDSAPNLVGRIRLLSYDDFPGRQAFEPGTYVLAGLASLNAGMLRLLEQLHRRLSGMEGFRFLNHPTRTLQRFELLTELLRVQRNEFQAVRAGGALDGLRYPVFLRSERAHTGSLSPLLHSARDVEAAIGSALVSGYRMPDLLVVEFCDTSDGHGYYRKYAAFIVGDRVLPRSLEYGRAWMLKDSGNEFSLSMVEEERDYVLANPHEKELAEIFRLAHVEYGRIDYAMKNGRVQTWEINLHPTIGMGPPTSHHPVPAHLKPIRLQARRHFYELFEAAWRAVDRTPDGEPPVAVALDPTILQAAQRVDPPSGRLIASVRRLLRPANPFLKPMVKPFHGLLGRRARAAQARRGRRSPERSSKPSRSRDPGVS